MTLDKETECTLLVETDIEGLSCTGRASSSLLLHAPPSFIRYTPNTAHFCPILWYVSNLRETPLRNFRIGRERFGTEDPTSGGWYGSYPLCSGGIWFDSLLGD